MKSEQADRPVEMPVDHRVETRAETEMRATTRDTPLDETRTADLDRPILLSLREELERLYQDREAIAETLNELIEDLTELRQQLRSEKKAGKATDGGKLLTEVRYWLKQANETEKEIAAIRQKEIGIAGAYGIDLEQAGLAVGCRLARLRACCGAE